MICVLSVYDATLLLLVWDNEFVDKNNIILFFWGLTFNNGPKYQTYFPLFLSEITCHTSVGVSVRV